MPKLSRNVGQKSIETVFSIAICRPTVDKWESKTLFISIFDPRSSIVDCRLPCVIWKSLICCARIHLVDPDQLVTISLKQLDWLEIIGAIIWRLRTSEDYTYMYSYTQV